MGKKIQAQAVNHPGASGFYLLPTGIDAFATRARLIDHAEKTLDLQYYIFHDDRSGKFLLTSASWLRLIAGCECVCCWTIGA